MLFYDKKNEKLGIDCWRAFECSWLDPKGRPQRAAFEFFIENHREAINSFELKKILQSITQTVFQDITAVQNFLQEKLKTSSHRLYIRALNHYLVEKHPLILYPGYYYHRETVRFLCALTQQPYCGELHISFAQELTDPLQLDWFLLDLRSKEFLQADYLDALTDKLQTLGMSYLISLHLARRGGISYQSIRWFEYPFIEPKNLLTVTIME
jgi:hypothetical protein